MTTFVSCLQVQRSSRRRTGITSLQYETTFFVPLTRRRKKSSIVLEVTSFRLFLRGRNLGPVFVFFLCVR